MFLQIIKTFYCNQLIDMASYTCACDERSEGLEEIGTIL
jgi:hypothetical protein